MNFRSSRLVWSRIWFPLALFALALFKLWVVHTEDILGSATEYDALWFVNSAKYWYWNAPYGWTAFVRPPAYPLWLALVHAAHLPQRPAIELLQLTAWLALVLALRRVGIPRWLCLVASAVLSLHPAGFRYYDFTMADNFYAAMLPFLLAGLITLMCGPARMSMSIWAGIALAILWNTREEALLLVILSFAWIALWAWLTRTRIGSWSAALHQIGKPLVTYSATAVVLIIVVYTLNYKTFGAFAKSEMSARSFQSLLHALLRIKPDYDQRFISIPRESFQRAFEISPTFGKLKEQLEGETGEAWRTETFRQVGVKNEIANGWTPWAIRQASSRIGLYETPERASHFFKKATREINQACDQKLVATRPVFGDFMDPLTLTGWKYVPRSFVRIAGIFVRSFENASRKDDAILRADQKQLYDEMTLRRTGNSDSSGAVSSRIGAWIARNHRFFVWALLPCTLIALVIVAAQHWKFAPIDEITVVIVLLGVTILLRVALFTVVDATCYPANGQRYLIPVMPLFSLMMLLSIYQGTRLLQQTFRKRMSAGRS